MAAKFGQILNVYGPFRKGKGGMDAKMDKISVRHAYVSFDLDIKAPQAPESP
jgi:hypothetical protein